MKKQLNLIPMVLFVLCIISLFLFPQKSFAGICGNNIVEAGEECDTGTAISDYVPNACRSGCRLSFCGDTVIDKNEECDDGSSFSNQKYNNDKIPDFCRSNCRKPVCGDGVVDIAAGEECDDNNTNASDGCYRCEKCFAPKDGLILQEGLRVRLCPGRYQINDINKDGAVIIRGEGMHVDCSDAIIVGNGSISSNDTKPEGNSSVAAAVNYVGKMFSSAYAAVLSSRTAAGPTTTSKVRTVSPTVSTQTTIQSAVSPSTTTSPSATQTNSSTAPYQTTSQPNIAASDIAQTGPLSAGVGISIEAPDVVLHNCHVENFAVGIEVKSENTLLFDNIACGNTVDIESLSSISYGIRNTCSAIDNWRDSTRNIGCMNPCQ